MGKVRTPLSLDQVGVYAQAPAHSDAVARLDSSGLGGFSSKREDHYLLQRLKRQAAALGANGILLQAQNKGNEGGLNAPASGPSFSAMAIYVPTRSTAATMESVAVAPPYPPAPGGGELSDTGVRAVQTRYVCPVYSNRYPYSFGFSVWVMGRVNRQGTVTSVKLVKSSNISVADALAEERAIARWRFKPLKIIGKRTAFRFIDHEYDSRDLSDVRSTCAYHASGHLRFKQGKYQWAVFLMPHGYPIAVPINQLKKS
jgi:TonB family protein